MTDQNISLQLAVKLASLVVHCEELLSEKGHAFDRHAILGLLQDPELLEWKDQLGKQGLLPVKR